MNFTRKTILKGALLLSPTILALLLVGGYWLGKGEQQSEAESEKPVHEDVNIEVRYGLTTLTLDEASQVRSGIQTRALGVADVQAGPVVYGTVVDLQPLLQSAAHHAANAAELAAAKTERSATQAELKRVQVLNEDDQNLSLKALGAAGVADASAAAKVNSAQASLQATAAALQQQFGPVLAAWARSPASPDLASLAARREVLVRFVLPPGLTAAPRTVTMPETQHGTVAARLVSASPQVDPGIHGQAWFYRAAIPLASGTRVTGRISAARRTGQLIPASAIVWYGGQPWAYVKTSPTRFERRAVSPDMPSNGDFLVTNGFASGDQVVVRGAQLLLSEESRALLGKD